MPRRNTESVQSDGETVFIDESKFTSDTDSGSDVVGEEDTWRPMSLPEKPTRGEFNAVKSYSLSI